jgi:hypothetical protein
VRRAALIITCAVAMGLTPAWANAATSPLVDTGFSAGTFDGTLVGATGALRLAPIGPRYTFPGPLLPAGWTADPSAGVTFLGGEMLVNDALVAENTTGSAGQAMVANATLASAPFQQLGYGTNFDNPPWAMFSTGGGSLDVGLYARTAPATGPVIDTPITGVNPAAPHNYRIEWDATEVRFYVDEQLVATNAATLTTPLSPAVSDAVAGGPAVSVSAIQSGAYTTGTFISRALDTTDTRASWGTLTPTPASPEVAYQTRTSLNGTTWSAWRSLGPNGAIESPVGRYIQYSATLTTSNPSESPSVQSVAISFAVDDVPPRTVIDSVSVFQTTATVRFASPDTDVAGFQCSLDGGAFSACASPVQFSGLSVGPHAVSVRALDTVGNVGEVVTRAFTALAPPLPPPTQVAIRLGPTTLKAFAGGVLRLRVRCVSAQQQCTVQIRLRRGGNTIARRTVTIANGAARTITLRLSPRTRRALSGCRTVRMSASLVARDVAGNRQTLRRTVTARRSGCRG